jgi:LacI family transcriptional regulator
MSIVAVAKRAGVSVATVSRVINDAGSVRSKTADQVREAMRAIGYTPPLVRRGPKTRRAVTSKNAIRQFAILNVGGNHEWLHLPVMGAVVSGVMRGCKELGIRPILDEMPDPMVLSSLLSDSEVNGAIVFMQSGVPEVCLEQIRQNVPLVRVTGGEGTTSVCDHVAAHNAAIGRLAFSYLARRNCRNLAFITDRPELQLMRMRGLNFNASAIDAGIPNHTYVVSGDPSASRVYAGDVSLHASLQEVVEHIVHSSPRIDGLFSPTDFITSLLYPIFERAGIVVGRDLTIISCDNERVRLSALQPRPLSIDLRGEEIGRTAVRTLLGRITNPNQPRANILINPSLDENLES